MPLLEVTGGPIAPSGLTLAAATLSVRYFEAYADGVNVYPALHEAEWDSSTGGWKPVGSVDGSAFFVPGAASGSPNPPPCLLLERQEYVGGGEATFQYGPMRIYQSGAGVWLYGTAREGVRLVVDADLPPAQAVLVSALGVPGGVATLDGSGRVEQPVLGSVSDARQVIAGDGLEGGGDLTADRTLDVDATVARLSGGELVQPVPDASITPAKLDRAYLEPAGGTVTGAVDLQGQVRTTPGADLGASGTLTLDLSGASLRSTAALTADVTFATSNLAAGRSVTVRVVNGGSPRALTFPVGWTFIGLKPDNIAADKTAILTITAFGGTDSDVVAAWAAEP